MKSTQISQRAHNKFGVLPHVRTRAPTSSIELTTLPGGYVKLCACTSALSRGLAGRMMVREEVVR